MKNLFDRIEESIVEKSSSEKERKQLHEKLRGIYALMRLDREFSEDDKLSIFNEIRQIVSDENF